MKDKVYKETCTDHPKPRSRIKIPGNSAIRRKLQTLLVQGDFTGSNSKNRVSKHEVHEPPIHDEDFPLLQKKLGITAGYSTFSMEALKTNVLIWRMFMSSSRKAAIHLGPNYLANLEVYKNTNFEEVQSLFNITKKLILEHSEEILDVRTIASTSLS